MLNLRIELLLNNNQLYLHSYNTPEGVICNCEKITSDANEFFTFEWGESAIFSGIDLNEQWINLFDIEKMKFVHEAKALLEVLSLAFTYMPGNQISTLLKGLFFSKAECVNDLNALLYGGSFNPIHEGHLECIRQGSQKGNVIVIPDLNPWKSGQKHQFSCPFEIFINLTKSLRNFDVAIYPGFLALEGVNPTVEWLPKTTFNKKSLLFGDDSFLGIEKWARADELIDSINQLYVVPRLQLSTELQKHIVDFSSNHKGVKLYLLDEHPYAHLSSSRIRESV